MSRGLEKSFWETTPLEQMTPEQWESLCDGCGRCCLEKLEDARAGRIYFTRVACELLDREACCCIDYQGRTARVPDCLHLTPDLEAVHRWLPETCAYRLLHLGQPLRHWHPLVSGDPRTVHREGISVRDVAIAREEVPDDATDDLIVLYQNL